MISFISHATKQRLQNLLEKVSHVAQQKNVTFKVIIEYSCFSISWARCCLPWFDCPSSSYRLQDDEQHEQASDVRAQLKFLEQLDQMEKQRKEEQEREILLKAAKVTKLLLIVLICHVNM